MLTSDEVNILGQLLNSTWGLSFSSNVGDWPRASAPLVSIKGHLATRAGPPLDLPLDVIKRQRGSISPDVQETQLMLTYTDFVTFQSNQEMHASMRRFRDIAEKACSAFITEMKKKFNEASSRRLKIKFIQDHDSVESIHAPTAAVSLIGAPRHRPEMYRGYYRYTGVYSIS